MATIHQCDQCGAVLEKKSYGYFCVPCWVYNDRTSKGLPPKITDPVVLADIARMLKPYPRPKEVKMP